MRSVAPIVLTVLGALACQGGPAGPDRSLFAEGGEPGQHQGTVTLDEYDWFSTTPWLGPIAIDLRTGAKRRFVDGRYPWTHPDGMIVFSQPCGDRVHRVAILDEAGLIEIATPCSSEIANPGASPTDFGFAKLSPDGLLIAVEAVFFVDFDWAVSTVVFERGGELIATFDGYYAPEWTPDGRLLLAAEGLYLANRRLDALDRIDGGQLAALVNNPAVHPDGERIVFEYNQQIWEMRLDGTDLQERVYADRRLRYPTWSPDGSTIVYLGLSQQDYYDRALLFTDLDREVSTWLDLSPVLGSDVSVVPNGPLSWR